MLCMSIVPTQTTAPHTWCLYGIKVHLTAWVAAASRYILFSTPSLHEHALLYIYIVMYLLNQADHSIVIHCFSGHNQEARWTVLVSQEVWLCSYHLWHRLCDVDTAVGSVSCRTGAWTDLCQALMMILIFRRCHQVCHFSFSCTCAAWQLVVCSCQLTSHISCLSNA